MSPEKQPPPLRERWQTAVDVRVAVIDSIRQTEALTPDEAIRLANLYVSYSAEIALHNGDQLRHGDWSRQSPRDRVTPEELAERQDGRRFIEEHALRDAFNGDYRRLKTLLHSEGEDTVRSAEFQSRRDIKEMAIEGGMRHWGSTKKDEEERYQAMLDRTRRFGEQLLAMVAVIPDQGDPIAPPPPAWEIPR